MGDRIELAKLRSADVFLYHGHAFISRAIRFFDGTEVNHAGLYLGPAADQVTEALGDGVQTRPRAASVAGSEYVLAYRHKTAPDPMDPVTRVASRYVEQGVKYGYEQIVLLAILALTRRVRVNGLFGAFLRKVLDAATGKLADWIEGATGRRTMICSELVFRCYDDALEQARDVFTIDVEGLNVLPGGVPMPFGGPSPRRARRPEPGSILDALVGPAGLAFAPLGAEEAAPARPASIPSEAEIQEAGEAYLASVLEPKVTPAGFGAFAGDVDLDESLRRFAIAFQAAGEQQRPAPTYSVAGALQQLREGAAAFVTPGDLYKSRSLMRLGEVPAE